MRSSSEATPSARPVRDAGVTLVEIIVTVVMFGLVTGVIAAASVVVFRSEQGVVASTSEAQDTRQVVNYLPLDVGSGPRTAIGYRAVNGGAPGERGTACSESGDENVLRIDVSATERIAYHLVVPEDGATPASARIDRHVCALTAEGWTSQAEVNIADALDVPADGVPLHVSEVVVVDASVDATYQQVQTVRLDYVSRGRTETFEAAPWAEDPYEASGLCDADPFAATSRIAGFVIGDVTLVGTLVKSTLYVGGSLTFTGAVSVAQAVPEEAQQPVPEGIGMMVGSVDWATSTGTLSVLNGYDVQIAGVPGTDYVVQVSGPGGGGGGGGGGGPGGGGPGGGGGGPSTSTSVVGPAHVDGGPVIELDGSGGVLDQAAELSLDPAESFFDLTYCAERLAELPGSCNGTCAVHVGLPADYLGTSGTDGDTTLSVTPGLINVLNLDITNLADLSGDNILLSRPDLIGDTTPLVINVATAQGAAVEFAPPRLTAQGEIPKHVVWNFPNASSVTVTADTVALTGTLLAPYATVTSYAAITGGVVARDFVMYGDRLSDNSLFSVDPEGFWE